MARRKNSKAKVLLSISLVAILSVCSSLLVLSGCKGREDEKDNQQFNPSTTENEDDDYRPVPKNEPEDEEAVDEEENLDTDIESKPVISQPTPTPPPAPKPAPAPAPKPTPPPVPVAVPKPVNTAPAPVKKQELKDMTYDEAGYYNTEMFIQSALVKSKGVHVENKTVKGDFVIDNSVKNGNVYLDNLLIEGSLIVDSPYIDKLYLNDVQCKNVVIKDVGKYFSAEASGKSILDKVTTYDSAIFKERKLHEQCDGFVDLDCEHNVDNGFTDIVLDGCSLKNMKVDNPTNIFANDSYAYIDTLTAKRKADIKDGVKVRRLVNYSDETRYFDEPTYTDHRGDADYRYDDDRYYDRYYDRYHDDDRYYSSHDDDRYHHHSSSRNYLYEPEISVSAVTNSYSLEVDIDDIDRRADYVTVKLYVDGRYERSKRLNRHSRGYGTVVFEDGNDADLKNTSKEIRAYAVCRDDRYDDSDYARWRSITPKQPTLTVSNDSKTITVTGKNENYDYRYLIGTTIVTKSDGNPVDGNIDISKCSPGEHKISVKGFIKDNTFNGRLSGETEPAQITFTIPNAVS